MKRRLALMTAAALASVAVLTVGSRVPALSRALAMPEPESLLDRAGAAVSAGGNIVLNTIPGGSVMSAAASQIMKFFGLGSPTARTGSPFIGGSQ